MFPAALANRANKARGKTVPVFSLLHAQPALLRAADRLYPIQLHQQIR